MAEYERKEAAMRRHILDAVNLFYSEMKKEVYDAPINEEDISYLLERLEETYLLVKDSYKLK